MPDRPINKAMVRTPTIHHQERIRRRSSLGAASVRPRSITRTRMEAVMRMA